MTGLRVLLLENNSDALRLTTDILAAEGYAVYGCASCEQASRIASLIRPGIILFHACDGDEASAFRSMRAAAPYTPIVYFSQDRNCYEVYTLLPRNRAHTCVASGHKTITGAIRIALLRTLEAA